MFTFDQLASITQGKILANNDHGKIEHFLTDSRKVYHPKASAFVAIRGERHNGHNYIDQLFDLGARNFIIEDIHAVPRQVLDLSNILAVDNSIAALQQIAASHRKRFVFPVIGITGSNGKTIVKEWLGLLLSKRFTIVKSPKSYNSQLGVPLSVLQMSDRYDLGIFEAGISMTGEMVRLQPIINPTIGVFTNIGSAHDEGFNDRNQKSIEKWQLFRNSETVIFCADHKIVAQMKPDDIKAFTWGKHHTADIKINKISRSGNKTIYYLEYRGKGMNIQLPFIDDASLENAMHCIALMLFLGQSMTEISSALGKLTAVDMRLALKKGINNCYLIDDSYNNDIGGLQIALDFLKNQPGTKSRIILSDILQSGIDEKKLYEQLNYILSENQIGGMIGIGEGLMRNKSLFSIQGEFFKTTDQFLKEINIEKFQHETILIKGARAFGFERITNALSEKIHRTVLEINLDALNHNLNYYRSKLADDVKLMIMVKAAAYGSGGFEIANLLEFNQVDYLAVAYVDEGVELRKHGITLPIMVMNVVAESFENIIKYNLEPEVYSLRQLMELIDFVKDKRKGLKIHIKIDSGMHRLGFESDRIDELVTILRQNSFIRVVSIYSHLAGADEEQHNDFSREQVTHFLRITEKIEKGLKIHPLKHVLNSAGIIRFPEYQLDMVRLGIGLYGFETNQLAQYELQSISTLKTVISQVRDVKKGETIGYGRKGIVTRDSKIATIAIGYADGFLRAFGNGKIALMVNGKKAPVIGNICMDMSMLDITGIEASEGDEVIVFGENPTIKQLADAINTIPYEILTNISSRVSRVFYTN